MNLESCEKSVMIVVFGGNQLQIFTEPIWKGIKNMLCLWSHDAFLAVHRRTTKQGRNVKSSLNKEKTFQVSIVDNFKCVR